MQNLTFDNYQANGDYHGGWKERVKGKRKVVHHLGEEPLTWKDYDFRRRSHRMLKDFMTTRIDDRKSRKEHHRIRRRREGNKNEPKANRFTMEQPFKVSDPIQMQEPRGRRHQHRTNDLVKKADTVANEHDEPRLAENPPKSTTNNGPGKTYSEIANTENIGEPVNDRLADNVTWVRNRHASDEVDGQIRTGLTNNISTERSIGVGSAKRSGWVNLTNNGFPNRPITGQVNAPLRQGLISGQVPRTRQIINTMYGTPYITKKGPVMQEMRAFELPNNAYNQSLFMAQNRLQVPVSAMTYHHPHVGSPNPCERANPWNHCGYQAARWNRPMVLSKVITRANRISHRKSQRRQADNSSTALIFTFISALVLAILFAKIYTNQVEQAWPLKWPEFGEYVDDGGQLLDNNKNDGDGRVITEL